MSADEARTELLRLIDWQMRGRPDPKLLTELEKYGLQVNRQLRDLQEEKRATRSPLIGVPSKLLCKPRPRANLKLPAHSTFVPLPQAQARTHVRL